MSEMVLTQTPLTALINAMGLSVQSSMASLITGTPVFSAAALTCLGGFILFFCYKKYHGSMNPIHVTSRIFIHVSLFILAFSILKSGVNTIVFSSFDKKPWSQYAKVSANPKFSSLSKDSSANTVYAWIYWSLQELSYVLTNAVSDALGSDLYAKDPSFIYRSLGQIAVEGLKDPATAADLNALFRDCADTKNGFVFSNTASLKDVFDLTKQGCQEEWNSFQSNVDALNQSYQEQMSGSEYDLIGAALNGLDVAVMAHLSVANAVMAHIKAETMMSHIQSQSLQSGQTSALDGTTNPNYTYSHNLDDQIALSAQHPYKTALLSVANWLGLAHDKDAFELFNKAEIASVFNQISYLIPAATAIIQMILCVAFVFVVFAMGCGFIKPFLSWLYALFMVSMYTPISVFIYKIPLVFMNQSALASSASKMAEDPLMLVGAKLIDSQITQIQTVCIALQIMAFFVCVMGSIKGHQHFRSASGQWGSGMMDLGSRAVHMMSGGGLGHASFSTPSSSESAMPSAGFSDHPSSSGGPAGTYGRSESQHQSAGFYTPSVMPQKEPHNPTAFRNSVGVASESYGPPQKNPVGYGKNQGVGAVPGEAKTLDG